MRQAAQRRRSAKEGKVRVDVVLTKEEVETIDQICEAQGLPSRGAAISLLLSHNRTLARTI